MNREFRSGLRHYVGQPDMALPDDLAELAARLERKLAGENEKKRSQGPACQAAGGDWD